MINICFFQKPVVSLYCQVKQTNKMKKLLIGGQALRSYGSSRHTSDFDYLVFNSEEKVFFFTEEADYINAAKNAFFFAVWEAEQGNTTGIASLDAIAELKAYSYVQDCQNRNWAKADNAEFDLKFCARMGAKLPTIVQKFVEKGIFANEIAKIWKQIETR